MRKNYFLIGVFALATITFAACSSEGKLGEERSDDNGNTEVIEGEPTWAKFTFKPVSYTHLDVYKRQE